MVDICIILGRQKWKGNCPVSMVNIHPYAAALQAFDSEEWCGPRRSQEI